jgi:EmrB/QacA subfamily drug resistance transporter
MDGERIRPRRLPLVTAGVFLALFLVALDQFVVGNALPRIVAELHALDSYAWVLTAYLVTLTTITPVAGKLGDLFGRRALLLTGMTGFVVSSALCGFAADFAQLVALRAVQGGFGGLLFANVFAAIADLYSAQTRVRVQGALGAVFAVASLVGPTLGGFLTDTVGWRAVFYVNVPVGIVAVAMPRVARTARLRDIGIVGALALACGIVPLLVALSIAPDRGWDDVLTRGLIVLSAVLLVSFYAIERRAREPIVSFALFRDRTVAVAAATGFLVYVAFFAALVFAPLLYQGVLAIRASDAGVLQTPMLLGVVAGSVLAGQVISRLPRYRFLGTAAIALLAIACGLLAQVGVGTAQADVVRDLVLLGAGVGITLPLYLNSAQAAVDRRFIGAVTGQVQFFRQVGGSIGIAVLGSLLSQRLGGGAALDLSARVALAGALHDVFLVAAASAAIAIVISLFLREVPLGSARVARPEPDIAAAAD